MKVKRIVEFDREFIEGIGDIYKCGGKKFSAAWFVKYTDPTEEPEFAPGNVYISINNIKYVVTRVDDKQIYIMYPDGSCGAVSKEQASNYDVFAGRIELDLLFDAIVDIDE